jgi:hypothetical protein
MVLTIDGERYDGVSLRRKSSRIISINKNTISRILVNTIILTTTVNSTKMQIKNKILLSKKKY